MYTHILLFVNLQMTFKSLFRQFVAKIHRMYSKIVNPLMLVKGTGDSYVSSRFFSMVLYTPVRRLDCGATLLRVQELHGKFVYLLLSFSLYLHMLI